MPPKPHATRPKAGTVEPTADALDHLLQTRVGGAINIRGIRFQLLYSLLRALDLFQPDGPQLLRLEGIEDADVLGMTVGTQYIQVKTSVQPWTMANLKEPVRHFLDVLRLDPAATFVLACNFELSAGLVALNAYKSLSGKAQREVRESFRRLCTSAGGSRAEADQLLVRLHLESISASMLQKTLERTMASTLDLQTNVVDVYLRVFVERFLTWAQERATITRGQLVALRVETADMIARETVSNAYGLALIDRVDWSPSAAISDFFEGKATRPTHIARDADVKRPKWLKRIRAALDSTRICILRAPSGQGKSTLMYRFARDHWMPDSTRILKAAATPSEVGLVAENMRFLRRLGIIPHLLVDNVDFKTRLWLEVAQVCVDLGGRVLATVRTEDWARYGNDHLVRYEALQPLLERDEAQDIFRAFAAARRLDGTVKSADWAYEQVGSPPLLLEYIFLLTHGTMLKARLTSQLRAFALAGEGNAKTELLRRCAFANSIGVPVQIDLLVSSIPFREDPQTALQSLDGEYIQIQDGEVVGLHQLRTSHLAHLLHENYRNPAATALETLASVRKEHLASFVFGTMTTASVDRSTFFDGLVQRFRTHESAIDALPEVLAGLFEAGEHEFFTRNRAVFDAVYRELGIPGIVFLENHLLPLQSSADAIEKITSVALDSERATEFKEHLRKVVITERGLDRCQRMLLAIIEVVRGWCSKNDLSPVTGQLLDWSRICKIDVVRSSTVTSQTQSLAPASETNDARSPFDRQKNGVLASITRRHYSYDGFHAYQAAWAQIRLQLRDALRFLIACVEQLARGKHLNAEHVKGFVLVYNANDGDFTRTLRPPLQAEPTLRASLEASPVEWCSALRNSTSLTFRLVCEGGLPPSGGPEANRDVFRPAIVQARNAAKSLSAMHTAFEAMFQHYPDYFDLRGIVAEEKRHHSLYLDLLEFLIVEGLDQPVQNVRALVLERRSARRRLMLRRLQAALEPVSTLGGVIYLPHDVWEDANARHLAVGLGAETGKDLAALGQVVLDLLSTVSDVAHFFYVVPRLPDGSWSDRALGFDNIFKAPPGALALLPTPKTECRADGA